MRDVAVRGGHVRQCTCAFGQRAHRAEHAPHVRVMDDRDRLLRRAVDRTALHALLRKRRRFLVRAIGDADALHPDAEARRVHHDEHVFEPAILFADQIADCAAVIAVLQHRGRARLDAELVFDRHAMHVVARAERAVFVDEEFRHDEQRNALHAFRCVRRAREHQMDDVVGHVVLAPRDEDLRAEHLVGAVALRLRARAYEREVGAGLRLGQVHRARPFAGDQLRHVALLLLVAAGRQQSLDRAVGQQRTQRERQVRRVQHLDARRRDQLRQPLAVVVGRMLQPLPAAFDELAERFAKAGRRAHHAVLPAARIAVALDVQRRQHLAAEFRGLFEHRLGGVVPGILETRQLRDGVDAGQFLQHEQHVLDGGGIAHGRIPIRR
ncbi:hypothetical protein FEP56_05627 [Burkholderia multivorans]|nr:hypothetical protein [Burkholderia multivorans]